MSDYEADTDSINESLFEDYCVWCEANKLPATNDGFTIWLDERFDWWEKLSLGRGCGFRGQHLESDNTSDIDLEMQELTIVGNKYENPELLEKA